MRSFAEVHLMDRALLLVKRHQHSHGDFADLTAYTCELLKDICPDTRLGLPPQWHAALLCCFYLEDLKNESNFLE